MLRSMTGYGRSKCEFDSREYTVEIKSVNNRYSDISIKLPRSISFMEDNIKKLISKSVTRGKVEVFISFINNSDKGRSIEINRELAKNYISNRYLKPYAVYNEKMKSDHEERSMSLIQLDEHRSNRCNENARCFKHKTK
jgi:uncharacterized protein (TIGR00255 family)